MAVLIIDNYDSFTYNLVHLVEKLDVSTLVLRNDRLDGVDIGAFDAVIFSPGPSLPEEAGRMMEIIDRFHNRMPMLGICLGFQALVEYFGGSLINLSPVRHGIDVEITHLANDVLFTDIEQVFTAGLYHSWGTTFDLLPRVLEPTSVDSEGVVMSIKHSELPLHGVQFHPESVMTPLGPAMVANWLESFR